MRISSVIDGLELEEIKNTELICVKCFLLHVCYFFFSFQGIHGNSVLGFDHFACCCCGFCWCWTSIQMLRRRRQVISATRPQTIEIEEIGPMIEAAPLSPRRRKSERGSRSQSFESIELFSVNKKDQKAYIQYLKQQNGRSLTVIHADSQAFIQKKGYLFLLFYSTTTVHKCK